MGNVRVDRNGISGKLHENYIINGDFDFWQRGDVTFSLTNTDSYIADRFYIRSGLGSSLSITSTETNFSLSQTDVPDEPEKYLAITGTSTAIDVFFGQRIESVRTLAGKKVTLSLWCRKDSAYTAVTPALTVTQHFGTGGSPSPDVTVISSESFTNWTDDTWVQNIFTFDVPSISSKTIGSNNNDYLEIEIALGGNANHTSDWAHFSLVEGDTPFFYKRSSHDELQLCQRYFEKSYDLDVAPGSINYNGVVDKFFHLSDAAGAWQWQYDTVSFKVTKRAIPQVKVWGAYNSTFVEDRVGIGNTGENLSGGASYLRQGNNGFSVSHDNANNSRGMRYHWRADAEL